MTIHLSAYTESMQSADTLPFACPCGLWVLSTNTKLGREFALGMLRVLSPLSRGASRFPRRESTVR